MISGLRLNVPSAYEERNDKVKSANKIISYSRSISDYKLSQAVAELHCIVTLHLQAQVLPFTFVLFP